MNATALDGASRMDESSRQVGDNSHFTDRFRHRPPGVARPQVGDRLRGVPPLDGHRHCLCHAAVFRGPDLENALAWTLPRWYAWGLVTPFVFWLDRRLRRDHDASRPAGPARAARRRLDDRDDPPAAGLATPSRRVARRPRRLLSRSVLFGPADLRRASPASRSRGTMQSRCGAAREQAHDARAPDDGAGAPARRSRSCRACARSCSRTFSSTRSTRSAPSPNRILRWRGG